jgi:MYXO-CTERM domain-containing protein
MLAPSSLRLRDFSFGVRPPGLLVGTWTLALAAATSLAGEREARACGGCMHPPPGPTEVDSTIVTDHRMVFSISPAQTVLWDQIRYSGKPSDFAWVLPVKPGARIELSHDAWIASLDAATQTVIQGPVASCYSAPPTEYNGSSSGGCFGGSASNGAADFAGSEVDASTTGPAPVQVVSQQVVGPYQAVTVRSSQGEALGDWLRTNGYDVPAAIQPTIDAFSSAGFDFIALRLAPGEGVQAMQPVRVITPGADPSLPLRMVAAGVGANVGLELFVLSEGRYHPQNFPDATIDFTQLKWDPYNHRSNYTDLAAAALVANGGQGWLTESSGPANLYSSGALNPPLATTYGLTCQSVTLPPAPGCGGGGAGGKDAGVYEASIDEASSDEAAAGEAAVDEAAADEAAADDAGVDEAAAGEAGVDEAAVGEASAGESDGSSREADASRTAQDGSAEASLEGGGCASVVVPCDDLTLAMTGIAAGRLWVTRLRADLPAAALSADLILEATADQSSVSNVHSTSVYTDPKYQPCPNSATSSSSSSNGGCACRADDRPHAHYEDVIVGGLGIVAIAGIARRRRPRKA